MQFEEVNGVEVRQRIENLRVPVAFGTFSLDLVLECCLPIALELAAKSKRLFLQLRYLVNTLPKDIDLVRAWRQT